MAKKRPSSVITSDMQALIDIPDVKTVVVDFV